MDGISGVASRQAYSNIWRYTQSEKTAQSPIATASQDSGSASASGLVSEAKSPVSPSLLVAVQESDVIRQGAGEEEESVGLFTHDEETEEEKLIAEILDKGLVEWAHEQWLEKIREKARQNALSEMGLTEGDLAAMTPEIQAQIERILEQKVEEAIQSAIEDASNKNGEHQQADAMVVSPIVTGG